MIGAANNDRPGAPPPAPPADPRLLPVLVAVGYIACLIAAWGFTSLLLDRDVITETDAGPLLGPSMALSAAIVVAVSLWRLRRRRSLTGVAVATAASAYLAMLLVGSLGYSTARADAIWLLLFTARYALSPFVVGAALLGGLSVVFLWAVTVRERRERQEAQSDATDT